MIGRSLSHYAVREELSRGGMGVVYRALDVKLEREVALKVLPPELVRDEERKHRFLQEARAAASLKHPNIAVIHEVDEVDGVTFLVMELIEGEKLSDLLARERLPFSSALTLAIEVADGLSRAHERGIVHRDLKPANIMVAEDGHPKIIDFGLAKLMEPLHEVTSQLETAAKVETRSGQVMGTPAYMSPEQAQGRRVDHRSDLFSLGIVLYEMLTGKAPFTAASASELPHAIIHDTPKPLGDSLLAPTAPEMQRIVTKCLAKDPGDRYQSARDLFIDLRGVKRDSESHPSIATTVSAPWRMGFAGRMGIVAVGALVLAALGFLVLRGPPSSPRPRVVRTFQLTRDPSLEADPAISPDGKFVAYAKGPVAETRIYVQQVSGGRAVPLTAGLPGTHTRPRWSPDGAQIAFSTDFGGQDDGIAVVPALGGAPRRIAALAWEPAWSPDGEEIAYLAGPTGEALFVAPVRGGEPRRLIERIISERHAPEGRLFVVSADNGEMQGEEAKPFNELPAAVWSPDGRWIAGFRPGADNLALFAPDGREIRMLAPGVSYPRWSSDGRTVYYRKMRDIWRVALSGGAPELLVRFDEPERPSSRSEWALDGERFYFTLTEYEGDVWVMELQ